MTPEYKLGDFLRNMRDKNGYSMSQVVTWSCGLLDKTTLSRIENNTRMPNLRAAYAFSQIYKIDLVKITEMTLGSKIPAGPADFTLSSHEKMMIERYRQLSRRERQLVMRIMNVFPENNG